MRIDHGSPIKHFFKQTNGGLTLESALVFPLFLLLIFTIIIIGVLMLNVNTLHFVQLTAVERAAFNWDKYDRNFSTGIKRSELVYGTYEHDLMLTALSRLFNLNSKQPITTIQISEDKTVDFPTGALRSDKLLQANDYLFNGKISFSGELQYVHEDFLPRVAIKTEANSLPLNLAYRGSASTIIVDATQHIRGVDLLIYYGQKLGNMKEEAEGWIDKAKAAIPSS